MDLETTQSLDYLLERTSHLIHRQADQILQERLGIGMSQYKVLRLLQAHGKITQRFVAVCLTQTEASISRQIKLLQSGGIVHVERNETSRREHLVLLTHKGMRLTMAATDLLETHQAPLLSNFSNKEQKQFARILGKLQEQFSDSATGRQR